MDRGEALSDAVSIVSAFDGVAAVGLSGSAARGNDDAMSDLDIAVFVSGGIPDPAERKRRYESLGASRVAYLDVNLDVSRCDGVVFGGVDCGFIWMEVPRVERFLGELSSDLDCDEFLPGGLMTMRPLLDPAGTLASLRDLVPTYPPERAMHRIRSSVNSAHFSLYVLAWLQKAATRNDGFSFLKYEYEVLDAFFTALFALNRRWYADEKRLTEIVRGFGIAPAEVAGRIESLVLRKADCATLPGCLRQIKSLFRDLVVIALREYPSLDIPCNWE